MPAQRGQVAAHVATLIQDDERIITLGMSEAQLLELMAFLTVALREKSIHADGFYDIAIGKDEGVNNCKANPPCQGGDGTVNLVRPRRAV